MRRRNALVRNRENLALAVRFSENLLEELQRLAGSLVRPDPRQQVQSPGAGRTRHESVDHRVQLCLRPPRIACLEVKERGLDRSSNRRIQRIPRRELAGAVEEQRSRA